MDLIPGTRRNETIKYVLGADPGQSVDPTALCVIEHHKTFRHHISGKYRKQVSERFDVRHLQRLPLGLAYPEIVQEVARIDTNAIHSLLDSDQTEFTIIVNIGDERYPDTLLDLAESQCIYLFRNGDPHQLASDLFKTVNLRHCCRHVPSIHGGHRLDGNGRISTKRYIADVNLA